jgi:uncharacterized protein (DUF983 family)
VTATSHDFEGYVPVVLSCSACSCDDDSSCDVCVWLFVFLCVMFVSVFVCLSLRVFFVVWRVLSVWLLCFVIVVFGVGSAFLFSGAV